MKEGEVRNHPPRLVVRPLTLDDFEPVVRLQHQGFPGMGSWGQEQFARLLEIFPEGQLGVELDGKLAASSSSLLVDPDEIGWRATYDEVTDRGALGTHDPEGTHLYGIEIVVDLSHRGLRLARRLYDTRKELCRELNLVGMLIAGRMPNLHKHPELSGADYLKKVLAKEIEDRVINAQVRNGFTPRAVIENYLPEDKESREHAVLMEWRNPFHVPDSGTRPGHGSVTVAAVQMSMRTCHSFEEFGRQCEFFIGTAGGYHADFLLFPELLTTQLQVMLPDQRPDLDARGYDAFTNEYLDFFSRMAIRYNVNIIGGSHMTREGNSVYNVGYLFRRDGSVGRQPKLHITPDERFWWGTQPGDKLEVFDTDRGKIAILVCYDIEFPELARIAVHKGAQILFVPYNTDIRTGYLRVSHCAHARCIENHVYAVLSGAVGNLPFVAGADLHYGVSGIYTPSDIMFDRDGVAAEATPNVETMLVTNLDLDLLRRTRRTGAVRTWLDRRSDLYRIQYQDDGQERWV